MKSRHQARVVALQVLYRYDVAKQADAATKPPVGAELAAEISTHFEHWAVDLEIREFSAQLVAGTLAEIAELDQTLEKHVSHWKVARLGFVDRSLLRMSVYELKHFPDTSSSVVIDEAIELAKEFGTADSPAFVNGVLDAVKKTVRP